MPSYPGAAASVIRAHELPPEWDFAMYLSNCQTYGNLRDVHFGNSFPNTVAIHDENKLNDKTPSNLGHGGLHFGDPRPLLGWVANRYPILGYRHKWRRVSTLIGSLNGENAIRLAIWTCRTVKHPADRMKTGRAIPPRTSAASRSGKGGAIFPRLYGGCCPPCYDYTPASRRSVPG